MTDSELVKTVARQVAPDNSAYVVMAKRFCVRPDNLEGKDPFGWDRIFANIAGGHFTLGTDIREKFEKCFAAEIMFAAAGLDVSSAEVPAVDRTKRCTTDHAPLDTNIGSGGQQKNYVVLCDEERGRGFVRPVRTSYKHLKCGAVTTMGQVIAETYARDPGFYGGTFCATCRAHFPVGEDGEFVWLDGSKVGT
jgi:hypothetical protein